ncbi:MAG: hypothetical protein ACI3V5_02835 [Faecousia sp.]
MKIAVFAFSRQGCATARRAEASFPESESRLFTVQRLTQAGFEPIPKPSKPFYGALFSQMDALIFVGSCGIAVREIAPHVKSKQTDPAVIVVDELGKFVIPLLAGHIGGANALALRLAQSLDAAPVVTTATDIHRRFSVDAWAARQHFVIDSRFSGVEGIFSPLNGLDYEGYEIHMGRSEKQLLPLVGKGNVYGSYIHGVFDAPGVADAILTALCRAKGVNPAALNRFDVRAYREQQYDKLADAVRGGLDMEYVYRVLNREV